MDGTTVGHAVGRARSHWEPPRRRLRGSIPANLGGNKPPRLIARWNACRAQSGHPHIAVKMHLIRCHLRSERPGANIVARREKVRRLIERNTRVIISFRSRAVYIWVYDGTGRGSSRFAHTPRNLEPVGIPSDRSRSRVRRSWQRRRLAELLAELLQQVIVRELGLGGVGEGHLQLLEAALDDDGVAPRDALVPGRG